MFWNIKRSSYLCRAIERNTVPEARCDVEKKIQTATLLEGEWLETLSLIFLFTFLHNWKMTQEGQS